MSVPAPIAGAAPSDQVVAGDTSDLTRLWTGRVEGPFGQPQYHSKKQKYRSQLGRFSWRVGDADEPPEHAGARVTFTRLAHVAHLTGHRLGSAISGAGDIIQAQRGSVQFVFKAAAHKTLYGIKLLWWAPVPDDAPPTFNSPAFTAHDSRYGSVRFTITLERVLTTYAEAREKTVADLLCQPLASVRYETEHCHTMLVSVTGDPLSGLDKPHGERPPVFEAGGEWPKSATWLVYWGQRSEKWEQFDFALFFRDDDDVDSLTFEVAKVDIAVVAHSKCTKSCETASRLHPTDATVRKKGTRVWSNLLLKDTTYPSAAAYLEKILVKRGMSDEEARTIRINAERRYKEAVEADAAVAAAVEAERKADLLAHLMGSLGK